MKRPNGWLIRLIATKPDQSNLAETLAHIEAGLNHCLDQLPGFTKKYQLIPGSLRLPWNRLFEVDFTILVKRLMIDFCKIPNLATGACVGECPLNPIMAGIKLPR